jgi:uncharacterized membrane protein YraQ (UPF0718 family)
MFKKELKYIVFAFLIFLFFYFLPLEERFLQGLKEAVYLTHEYAREHVIFCLIPALFIAGAITTFLSQAFVMKYLGANAPKYFSYPVASVSGTILAVCSCTVLPIFAGIYLRGAGIGPATTFLYSSPAINVLAIVLTAKILGSDLGLARALGSILGSIIIGLIMEFIFIKEEKTRLEGIEFEEEEKENLPLYKRISVLALLTGILVFATWGGKEGIAYTIYSVKWYLVSLLAIILGIVLIFWFNVSKMKIIFTVFSVIISYLVTSEKEISFLIGVIGFSYALSSTKGEMSEWFQNTYLLAKQVFPLLFIGVFIAGLFFGRPGHEAIIPSAFVYALVGGNSIFANFFASLIGVLMYFATLTEVPIIQGLLGAGMGYGPALALLLTGPAVSLPTLLVLKSIWGPKKTLVYGALALTLGSICGYLFGLIRG